MLLTCWHTHARTCCICFRVTLESFQSCVSCCVTSEALTRQFSLVFLPCRKKSKFSYSCIFSQKPTFTNFDYNKCDTSKRACAVFHGTAFIGLFIVILRIELCNAIWNDSTARLMNWNFRSLLDLHATAIIYEKNSNTVQTSLHHPLTKLIILFILRILKPFCLNFSFVGIFAFLSTPESLPFVIVCNN